MGKRTAFILLSCFGVVLGLRAQDVEWEAEVVGMAGRPYQWNEVMPLTGVAVSRAVGTIGMDDRVVLSWPDDGRMHLCELHCAGVVWTLPLCGPLPADHRLVPPKSGGAPFTARPGAVAAPPSVDPGLPLAMAALRDAVGEVEAGLEAELQRSLLWNGAARRGGEAEALGQAIGEPNGASENADSLRQALVAELQSLADRHAAGQPPAAVAWMQAAVLGPCLDADAALRETEWMAWQNTPAPDPTDAAAVRRFVEGALRFATVAALPDSTVEVYARGVATGDWAALTAASAGWWGGPDEDKTAAWCAHRLGQDAFGMRRSGRPFAGRAWPSGWMALLDELESHPMYGAEVAAWRQSDAPLAQLPKSLRAFDATENLVDLESVVGSGPALWLWMDASAPSTTVPLQVLERMLADPKLQRVVRGMEWVVADVGTDWEAFQRLTLAVVKRYGGLSRVPFRMVHVGGDVRWTQAFELSALPAVRVHGPDRVPVAAEWPLPGPELSRRLAKRP